MRSFALLLALVTGCQRDVTMYNYITITTDSTEADTDTAVDTDGDTDVADTDTDTDTGADTGDTDTAVDTDTMDTGLPAYTCTPITTGEQDPKYIKSPSLSTVYYVAPDCLRYTFPHSKVFLSWEDNFDGVVTISDSDTAALVLGGNMTYKPGVVLVKIQSDPKVYAVTENPLSPYSAVIRWIETEQLALDIYGPTWNEYVVDVPDVFFPDYTIGPSVASPTDLTVDLSIMKTRVELGP